MQYDVVYGPNFVVRVVLKAGHSGAFACTSRIVYLKSLVVSIIRWY